MSDARILTINVVHELIADPVGDVGRTAIDKRPVEGPAQMNPSSLPQATWPGVGWSAITSRGRPNGPASELASSLKHPVLPGREEIVKNAVVPPSSDPAALLDEPPTPDLWR